jgi:predicted MFS family arabinose efflux permease
VSLALLAVGHTFWAVAPTMVAWGALNSALPVVCASWLTKGIGDEPESGGGLMVGTIQLSIMLGAAFGGLLLDHLSIAATLVGGAMLLVLSSLKVGDGSRIRARMKPEERLSSQRVKARRHKGHFGACEQSL